VCTMHTIWKAISCSHCATPNIASADTVFTEVAMREA